MALANSKFTISCVIKLFTLLRRSAMNSLMNPVLADYIWIGGGTLGLIVLVVLIVVLVRR